MHDKNRGQRSDDDDDDDRRQRGQNLEYLIMCVCVFNLGLLTILGAM